VGAQTNLGAHGYAGRVDDVVRETVSASVRWLDAHHGNGQYQQTLRILKVTEEAGEVAQAWIGMIGQNPRKGVTHSSREVADELADVALTALVAIESMGFDPHEVLAACAAKVLKRLDGSQAG
jgi:NTP pyrophosphatase (non-canonical NTP hydrolase)